MQNEIAELKSVTWLMENFHHIWFNKDLTREQRAGFLAACCDARRCYLTTLSLKDRVALIQRALPK